MLSGDPPPRQPHHKVDHVDHVGSGVAPQTPIPPHTMGQQGCFGILGMGVFEMDNAKKYCLGSRLAPQTPIPLHTMGQQGCFWIPEVCVFEMDNAKKRCLGSGVALGVLCAHMINVFLLLPHVCVYLCADGRTLAQQGSQSTLAIQHQIYKVCT